jgi:PIN domain nuclease of toxin-antitoxin system
VKLLLDTHAFLWWLNDDDALGPRARDAIAAPANLVFVSAATAWEIAVKRALGKLEAPGDIESWISSANFEPLAITVADAVDSAELPPLHRDPFDRLLVAQALRGGLTLVTKDEQLAEYGVAVAVAADYGAAGTGKLSP